VVYSISVEVLNDPKFHQAFIDAIRQAEIDQGLIIDVVPIPP
jgi:hypothetical protein